MNTDSTPPADLFAAMSGSAIIDAIEKHCLQITKGGYRWRDWWEVRVPAPGGHYRESDERLIGEGPTAGEAVHKALTHLGYSPSGAISSAVEKEARDES